MTTAANIDKRINRGQFYDAHQVLTSYISRLTARGKRDEAASLCADFALKFAAKEQYGLTADLAITLIDLWKEEADRLPCVTAERLETIVALFQACPPHSTKEKYRFINKAIKWTSTTPLEGQEGAESPYPNGHPMLHTAAGKAYWAEKDFGSAQLHLVFGKDGCDLAAMVREWQPEAYPSEAPLFPLRTTLMVLSMNDIPTAVTFVESLIGSDLDDPGLPPALQAAYLLAEACRLNDWDFFLMVQTKYQLVLRRDPSFARYLEVIKGDVFGVKDANASGGLMGMLSNLLQG
ncbi:unnamed protein product [Vitrella brassicaformis CCMP3155]|uniref:Golgi to ER traffic protein 4 n=1 Tax=Vitrella brassicaformis (strain CCMP3155) TaxID=1169540 RepID=A0A0G4EM25_VITBC|nr:unnamed protein product [Vitrella brassicaformis CCMP3155]|eukprot:CEL97893.1 unnamed protein product [Vitrella brassicaformis CCMP3155]